MRSGLVILFCVCIGLAASSAVSGAVSSNPHEAFIGLEGGARDDVDMPRVLQMAAARSDGGRWLSTTGRLWSLSAGGEELLHIDLAARGFGDAVALATDPYDGSVWIATDAPLLLHFTIDGSLTHGTTVPATARALAVDLDASAWVVAHDALMHFGRTGTWLETRPLDLATDERVAALAVDALRDRIWIATTRGLYRLATYGNSAHSAMSSGDIAAIALDQQTGMLLAIVDGSLVAVDDGMEPARTLGHMLVEGEQALAVLHDAEAGLFVVETDESVLRVANDGHVLDRRRASLSSMLAVKPFRVQPALALVRPPEGGAMADPHSEIVLRASALCNGSLCNLPPSYLQNVRVDATLDGIALGEARMETDGRMTFPLRPAMTPGVNELAATATDAFGHAVTLGPARWTLLADARNAVDANRSSVETGTGEATTKAANKPPSVALTAPASGATFSAGSSITLTANAADADGSIAKVEFYRGGSTLIGVATAAPYRFVWAGAAAGSYSLTAKAYDNRNGTAQSSPVTIVVVNNQLPAVAITSPASQSFARVGSIVTLVAAASDPDGTIASIEFFDGSSSLGTDTGAPYELTWNALPPGLHSITARATDDRGGVGISPSVDVIVGDAPIVVVTSPFACSTIDGPLDMLLVADAMSATGGIASVEFFDNGISVGTATAAPWQAVLLGASIGNHAITARATDDHGLTALSRPSAFTIRGANQPPTVAIAAPPEGAHFPFRAAVALTATAGDVDGTITAVDFRIGSAGGTLIGRATSAPYTISWANPAVGSYAVVAVALDDRNAATTSAAVHLTVDPNVLPAITVTAPAADTRYTAPATITLTANATDSDGSITKVDFFAGTTPVGSSTAPPYTVVWSNVGPGAYSLNAKATDNAGGVTTSAAVAISVVSNALPTVTMTAPAAGNQYFAPATISLAANAGDSDGTIASVAFHANGTLIGTSTTAPYGVVWDGVSQGAYSITATATDNNGATATSLPVSISVAGGPALNIDGALAGVTIDDDNILVRGFVAAPANSAVTVNGIVTHIDDFGRFQANDIPLAPGINIVTAVVTTQDGQTTTESVTINSTGPGAFVVHAAPTEGLDSLQMKFTVENPRNLTFKQVHFDLDNDGLPNLIATPSQFTDGTLTVTATYPAGTWLAKITFYDDQDRVIYSTSKSIVVRLPARYVQELRAVYDGTLMRLRVGNIPGALTAFTGSAYEKYNAIFTQLQPSLPSIIDQLGVVQDVTFNMDLAEVTVVRDTPDGARRFMIYLIRAEDGIWRIDGM